jgi:tRNA(Ile)-lysidine synthase
VLVAVSGGADSLALLDLLLLAGRWPLTVWHLDHGIRADTAHDLAAIRALLARHRDAAQLVVERADVPALARRWRCSLETAGRRQRHARLAAVAAERGIATVATAHHRDDQAETVLANLLRGAHETGRAGIPPRRRLAVGIELVRPLLALPRQALRDHLAARAIAWHEDATNADTRHRRNRIRRELLPALERAAPGVGAALVGLAARAQAEIGAADARLAPRWAAAFAGDRVRLAALAGLAAADRRRCWRRLLVALGIGLTRARLQALDDLAGGAVGRRLELGPLLFQRRADHLAWQPARPAPDARGALLAGPGSSVPVSGGRRLACAEIRPPADPRTPPDRALLDADALVWPLAWRRVAPGERWRPLGAPGRQTVIKTLAERKLPSRGRPLTMVLADANGVLWVPGVTIAERARLTRASRAALCVELACADDAAASVSDP